MKQDSDTTSEPSERLQTLSKYLPAEREADSEYNGPFSTFVEIHAFLFGLGLGYAARYHPEAEAAAIALVLATFGVERATGATEQVPEYIRAQVRKELHYFIGGYFTARYSPEAAAEAASRLSTLI